MLEALIIALREGIEAALLVAIIVAFLRKEGRGELLRYVWAGIGAAVLASVAGGIALRRVAVNEEVFEGLLYVASAVVVSSMLWWMWRHARALSGQIRGSLGRIVGRGGAAVGGGLFLFTFLMIFREGVETVLFLAAVSLTTSGVAALLGTLLGLLLATVFAVLFIRGSVRVDLGRFLRVTAVALFIFVVQLLVNGYHELAEAGWLPANRTSMAAVGPLVRHDVFFLLAILALPLLALAMPGAERNVSVDAAAANPAAERLRHAERRRARRSRLAACGLGVAVLSLLGMDVAWSQPAALSPPVPLVADASGRVSLPKSELDDGELHRYAVNVGGREVRFIALEVAPGRAVAAFDACVICGAEGYVEEGAEILCRHCHSAVYPPSIGQPGGCNPIPVDFTVAGGRLVLPVTALAAGAGVFGDHAAAHH
ncbi:MAG TPA: Fe-S-containing protein [Thermoanaerobaculia bacterium]|jgi:FTR1 family protein|nr:Fe-S-containing protein [Thermoanaerobaculia bacterium]